MTTASPDRPGMRLSSPTGRCRPCGISDSGDCAAVTIYALVGADEKPVYVGRTRRSLPARLRSHRSARHAGWLRECNDELRAWLEVNVPAAIVLDEVTDPDAEW